jgi:hypothetical protein
VVVTVEWTSLKGSECGKDRNPTGLEKARQVFETQRETSDRLQGQNGDKFAPLIQACGIQEQAYLMCLLLEQYSSCA